MGRRSVLFILATFLQTVTLPSLAVVSAPVPVTVICEQVAMSLHDSFSGLGDSASGCSSPAPVSLPFPNLISILDAFSPWTAVQKIGTEPAYDIFLGHANREDGLSTRIQAAILGSGGSTATVSYSARSQFIVPTTCQPPDRFVTIAFDYRREGLIDFDARVAGGGCDFDLEPGVSQCQTSGAGGAGYLESTVAATSFAVVPFVASQSIAVGARVDCSDQVDNDQDGLPDTQDPGCADGSDFNELHLRSGDILTFGSGFETGLSRPRAVLHVDPLRGVPANLASSGIEHRAIAIDSNGDVLLLRETKEILRLDAISGCPAVAVPADPSSSFPFGRDLAIDADGEILVLAANSSPLETIAILRIDRETGSETILATFAHDGPKAIAIEANGDVLAYDDDDIIRVDRQTGAQSILASFDERADSRATKIAIEASGSIIVTHDDVDLRIDLGIPTGGVSNGAVVRVDPSIGVKTLVADVESVVSPRSLGVGPSGEIYVGGGGDTGSHLLRVDPGSGATAILASSSSPCPSDQVCLHAQGSDDIAVIFDLCADGIDNDGDGLIDFAGGRMGEPADPGCVSERDNCEGGSLSDLNCNAVADEGDRDFFLRAFGHGDGQPQFSDEADYDRDGMVTWVDYQTWLADFNMQSAPPPVPTSSQRSCGMLGPEALFFLVALKSWRWRSRSRWRTR